MILRDVQAVLAPPRRPPVGRTWRVVAAAAVCYPASVRAPFVTGAEVGVTRGAIPCTTSLTGAIVGSRGARHGTDPTVTAGWPEMMPLTSRLP